MKTIQKMKLAIFLIFGISFFKCEHSMEVEYSSLEKIKIINNTAFDVKIKTYVYGAIERTLKDTLEIAAHDSLTYEIISRRGIVTCESRAYFPLHNDSITLLFSNDKVLALYGDNRTSMADYKNYDCEEVEGKPTTFIYTIDLDDYNLAK